MIVFGWIVELEQAGDLRSVIRRFTFILGVFIILWKIGHQYLLAFYICDYDNCIWWIVVLEHAGGLHGVIRSLQLILGVFIKFENLGGYSCWVMFVDYFLDFNTCKHSIDNCFVVDCCLIISFFSHVEHAN